MKRLLFVAAALIIMFPLLALARGHQDTHNGHQHNHGNPPPVVTPPIVQPPINTPPPPTPKPPITPPPVVTGEIRFVAYTTGYAAKDNTPAGSTQIDLGGHSGNAGGTGTFNEPITLAVGHSIINGQDIGDYPYGTKFYVPNLRKYFSAADSCGDGNTPQNGPCHTGYQGHVWLDLYSGASLANGVLGCEDAITGLHLVIENPSPSYAVVAGAIYNGSCAQQFGDTVITQ